MIHEAYMPVYRCQDFYCVRVCGRAGPPEVVQEALADLKRKRGKNQDQIDFLIFGWSQLRLNFHFQLC